MLLRTGEALNDLYGDKAVNGAKGDVCLRTNTVQYGSGFIAVRR